MRDPSAPFKKRFIPFNMKADEFNRVMDEMKRGVSPIEFAGYRVWGLRFEKSQNCCGNMDELLLKYDKMEPI